MPIIWLLIALSYSISISGKISPWMQIRELRERINLVSVSILIDDNYEYVPRYLNGEYEFEIEVNTGIHMLKVVSHDYYFEPVLIEVKQD